MKRNILAAILLLTFITFSCTTQEEPLQDNTASSRSDLALVDDGSIVDEPIVTVEDFILDDEETPDTKTVLWFDSSGAKFTFVDGDRLGIFPYSVSGAQQMPFTLKSKDASSAVFNCPGFSLTSGTSYAAYYPYNATDGLAATSVPVSYTGQTQTSVDGSTFNISSADYMLAQATPSGNACQFTMSHVGALVVLYLTVLDSGTYNELAICSDNASFVTGGTLNVGQSLTDGISLANTTTSKKISLTLGSGISLNAGQTYTFCMMVYPVDLSGSLVTVKLRDSNGKYHHAITPSMSRNLRQGYAYRFYPVIARTNLSTLDGTDSGRTETANCYIVDTDDINAAGYKFLCLWAGNGYAAYSRWSDYSFSGHEYCWPSGGGSSLPTIRYTRVPLNQNNCISNVYVSDDYIYFKADGNEGNAKIQARDANNDYAWVWHIWCTDKPGTIQVSAENGWNTGWGFTYNVMDRNMGALTNAPDSDIDKMCGFYYQFGNPTGFTFDEYNSGNSGVWRMVDGIAGYVNSPAVYLSGEFFWFNPYGADVLGGNNTYHTKLFGRLWGGGSVAEGTYNNYRGGSSVKTMYDPCPPGYKISPSECFGFGALGSKVSAGFYKSGVFFPYNGAANLSWASRGVYCFLWTPLFSSNDNAYHNYCSSSSSNMESDTQKLTRGMGVRCVKQ